VAKHIRSSRISTVSLAEVVAVASAAGIPKEDLKRTLEPLPLLVVPFGAEEAFVAGSLGPIPQEVALSLGDRACLALGLATGLPVLTANRDWRQLAVGAIVQVIR
jgi:PIN domain nuclease of toxin-antitoxin system